MGKPKDTRPTFIYVLKDTKTGEIRYVGQTVYTLEKRLAGHLREKNKNYKCNWIKSLKNDGVIPAIVLIQEVPYYDDWQYWERFWIKLYRDLGCKLVNTTDGGEGTSGYIQSAEHIAKRTAPGPNRKRTAETRERISKNKKGKKRTPEAIEKSSKGHMIAIAQYNYGGKFLKKWESVVTAERELGVTRGTINGCVRGKYKSIHGFQWRYWEETLGADIPPYVNPKQKRPVARYTSDDIFIDEWESAAEAARVLGLFPGDIGKCAMGKVKLSGGFIWKFIYG